MWLNEAIMSAEKLIKTKWLESDWNLLVTKSRSRWLTGTDDADVLDGRNNSLVLVGENYLIR